MQLLKLKLLVAAQSPQICRIADYDTPLLYNERMVGEVKETTLLDPLGFNVWHNISYMQYDIMKPFTIHAIFPDVEETRIDIIEFSRRITSDKFTELLIRDGVRPADLTSWLTSWKNHG